MAKVHQTCVSLVFIGEIIDIDEITRLLGIQPSRFGHKGEPRTPVSKRLNQYGFWRYSLDFKSPGEFDVQIMEIFDAASDDIRVWQQLTKKYKAHLFLGIFMEEFNEEISLSPEIIKMVAERNLTIAFDIYSQCSAE